MLGELADRVGLSSAYSAAVPCRGERAPVHDRGRLLAQVAVMLAAGGRCVADMAALRDQPALFGQVASDPTIWRCFDAIDTDVLDGLRMARAAARERVWHQQRRRGPVVLDVDASLVEIHSERKEQAASHYKGGYGFHPMFCFTDDGEALAGVLRPGNAAANSGADQLAVVDLAIAQLPATVAVGHRCGDDPTLVRERIVVRADTAGHVQAFVAGLVARNIEFSISARVSDLLDAAIMQIPARRWRPAINPDGSARRGAQIVELTGVALPGVPAGTRIIVRRERPHQGAQLRLWDHGGWRHQVLLTNSRGAARRLEVRHRRHGEVENRIKNAKDCGLERMPFTSFDANAAWMEMVLAAADLLVWTQQLLLAGELAVAEPRTLRYRLLHVAGRLVNQARQLWLRLPEHWPWSDELLAAYRRLAAIT
ncbi:MAG: IS1380 family transposase [Actinomycetota bacterium]|nr:IS1380 family transposase [Actinomycetota bacterium]